MGKHSIKRHIWREIYRSRSAGILPEWAVWVIGIGAVVAIVVWLF
jgi:hypothetical protein